MGRPSDQMRDLYEARAAQQYAAPSLLPDPRLDRKFARICTAVREQLPCEAFLDAGCGDGRYLAAMDAELPKRIAGVDIAERILETARARVPRADLRKANLGSLPFDDGAFDLVLSSQAIEHVLDAPGAVSELARVLRPGGTLVISTDNADNRITRALNAPRNAIVGLFGLRGRRGRSSRPRPLYARDLPRTPSPTAACGRACRVVPLIFVAARRGAADAGLNAPMSGWRPRLGDILLAVARRDRAARHERWGRRIVFVVASSSSTYPRAPLLDACLRALRLAHGRRPTLPRLLRRVPARSAALLLPTRASSGLGSPSACGAGALTCGVFVLRGVGAPACAPWSWQP